MKGGKREGGRNRKMKMKSRNERRDRGTGDRKSLGGKEGRTQHKGEREEEEGSDQEAGGGPQAPIEGQKTLDVELKGGKKRRN